MCRTIVFFTLYIDIAVDGLKTGLLLFAPMNVKKVRQTVSLCNIHKFASYFPLLFLAGFKELMAAP